MKYVYCFSFQLLFIGMAININTDIELWKQLIGYIVIGCIFPTAMFLSDHSMKE